MKTDRRHVSHANHLKRLQPIRQEKKTEVAEEVQHVNEINHHLKKRTNEETKIEETIPSQEIRDGSHEVLKLNSKAEEVIEVTIKAPRIGDKTEVEAMLPDKTTIMMAVVPRRKRKLEIAVLKATTLMTTKKAELEAAITRRPGKAMEAAEIMLKDVTTIMPITTLQIRVSAQNFIEIIQLTRNW